MDDSTELHNSLEDWVPIRPGLFADDPTCPRHLFMVAYNHIEDAVAITCNFGHRRAKDRHNQSMATSISLFKLQALHKELAYVVPELNQHFQSIEHLIQRQNANSRFYSYLFGIKGDGCFGEDFHEWSEELCCRVKNYLDISVSLCGRKLVFTLLFDVDFLADFEDDIHELRRQGYENLVNNAFVELNEVINLRSKTETLLEMTTVYAIEDEVIANASIALAELYNFQLQPFLKLRELASDSMRRHQQAIDDCDFGRRIKDKAVADYREAKDQYLSSSEATQQLYQEYYRKTVELVAAQTERMRCDRKRFGETAFNLKGGLSRLQKLELFLSQERLKLLNSIKSTKEFQMQQIRQQLSENVTESESIRNELFEMEINLLESKLDIIAEEEKLIKQKILILKTEEKQSDGNQEFYDAIDDEKQLQGLDDTNETDSSKVSHKLSTLNAKLNKLYQKRALIRNKKKSLIATKSSKTMNEIKEKQNFEKHHKMQIKKNIKPSESKSIVRTSDEKLKDIRRKTLERLKKYKLRALLNQRDDCDEDQCLSLPPYPSENQTFFNQTDMAFPPPPQPTPEQQCISESNSICLNPINKINLPSPPPLHPPPPPPPSIPPPPPPPPPPCSSTMIISKPMKLEKKESSQNSLTPCQITLEDIIAKRNKLKPIEDNIKQVNKSFKNGLVSALQMKINQRRDIVQESDSSDEDSDQEFDP